MNEFLGLGTGAGLALMIVLILWSMRVPEALPDKLQPTDISPEKLDERAHCFFDRSRRLRLWAYTIGGASIVALVSTQFIDSSGEDLDLDSVIGFIAVCIGGPISLLIARRVYIYERSIKRLQAKIASISFELNKEELVLYLRPFDSDGLRASLSDPETIEQKLVNTLSRLGQVVTIGKPEEEMPELGGVRLYLPPDQWQPKVEDLLRRARLVIIAVDEAEGVMWEIEAALRLVPPERIMMFLLFQFRRSGKRKHALYEQLQGRMDLPSFDESALFITFPGSTAHLISPELTPYEMLHGALTEVRIRTALHAALGKLSLGVELETQEEREARFRSVSFPMKLLGKLRYSAHTDGGLI
jgi:hypothetical protein